MDSKKKKINVNRVLPLHLVNKSAGSDLYRIGLSLFPFGSQKRKRIYNPYIIFSINVMFILRSILLLSLNDDNYNNYLYMGDYAFFLDKELSIYLNCVILFVLFFLIVSHLMHFWYYKKDIKPSYLKPFEMMSGLVSPKSIGLTDTDVVYRLIKTSKTLLIILKISVIIINLKNICHYF